MYRKKPQGWGKHLDFIMIDLCSMYLALLISYVIRHRSWRLISDDRYQSLLLPLFLLNITFVIASNGFKNVLRRGRLQELWSCVQQVALVQLGLLLYMYIMKISSTYSRQIIILMTVFYAILSYLFRSLWKKLLFRRMRNQPGNALVIMTTEELVPQVVHNVAEYNFEQNRLVGLILLDVDRRGRVLEGIPVVAARYDAAEYICREWVDEVLVALPPNIPSCEEKPFSQGQALQGQEFQGQEFQGQASQGQMLQEQATHGQTFQRQAIQGQLFGQVSHGQALQGSFQVPSSYDEIIEALYQMGVVVHTVLSDRESTQGMRQQLEKFGNYNVITSSINYAGSVQLSVKRLLDIIGGLVGCVLTVVLTVFLAPVIWIQSPGPVFFSQTRVGKNGRRFKIYKFRSMYLDADLQKEQLMGENRVKDGRMFKMEWDPRIIGSRILPDGKRKKGIGNFIRDYSIDEFPQFLNVLKGDMSLVGTRPPTVDEWERYKVYQSVESGAGLQDPAQDGEGGADEGWRDVGMQ